MDRHSGVYRIGRENSGSIGSVRPGNGSDKRRAVSSMLLEITNAMSGGDPLRHVDRDSQGADSEFGCLNFDMFEPNSGVGGHSSNQRPVSFRIPDRFHVRPGFYEFGAKGATDPLKDGSNVDSRATALEALKFVESSANRVLSKADRDELAFIRSVAIFSLRQETMSMTSKALGGLEDSDIAFLLQVMDMGVQSKTLSKTNEFKALARQADSLMNYLLESRSLAAFSRLSDKTIETLSELPGKKGSLAKTIPIAKMLENTLNSSHKWQGEGSDELQALESCVPHLGQSSRLLQSIVGQLLNVSVVALKKYLNNKKADLSQRVMAAAEIVKLESKSRPELKEIVRQAKQVLDSVLFTKDPSIYLGLSPDAVAKLNSNMVGSRIAAGKSIRVYRDAQNYLNTVFEPGGNPDPDKFVLALTFVLTKASDSKLSVAAKTKLREALNAAVQLATEQFSVAMKSNLFSPQVISLAAGIRNLHSFGSLSRGMTVLINRADQLLNQVSRMRDESPNKSPILAIKDWSVKADLMAIPGKTGRQFQAYFARFAGINLDARDARVMVLSAAGRGTPVDVARFSGRYPKGGASNWELGATITAYSVVLDDLMTKDKIRGAEKRDGRILHTFRFVEAVRNLSVKLGPVHRLAFSKLEEKLAIFEESHKSDDSADDPAVQPNFVDIAGGAFQLNRAANGFKALIADSHAEENQIEGDAAQAQVVQTGVSVNFLAESTARNLNGELKIIFGRYSTVFQSTSEKLKALNLGVSAELFIEKFNELASLFEGTNEFLTQPGRFTSKLTSGLLTLKSLMDEDENSDIVEDCFFALSNAFRENSNGSIFTLSDLWAMPSKILATYLPDIAKEARKHPEGEAEMLGKIEAARSAIRDYNNEF